MGRQEVSRLKERLMITTTAERLVEHQRLTVAHNEIEQMISQWVAAACKQVDPKKEAVVFGISGKLWGTKEGESGGAPHGGEIVVTIRFLRKEM